MSATSIVPSSSSCSSTIRIAAAAPSCSALPNSNICRASLHRCRKPTYLLFCRAVHEHEPHNSKRNKAKKWWWQFQRIFLQGIDMLGLNGYDDELQESDNESENGVSGAKWEDWLDQEGEEEKISSGATFEQENDSWDGGGMPRKEVSVPERGMFRNDMEITFGLFNNPEAMEDDVKYEDQVFQYASQTTAKFLAFLVLFPCVVGFVLHDYVMVPFLNGYVEHVPFAAQILDLRKEQKLQIVEAVKREKLRVHFEAQILEVPELTEEELWDHSKHKAKELREELRLENRKAFANIWSDTIVGITAFFVYLLNPRKVEVMKFTSSRILKGISDTGKAFLLILVSDIFLGYHSESGWHTLIEIFLEHYGLVIDDAAITTFICTVPVTIDVCFKLWVFKYLPRLSPSTAATFREMKRH